MADDAAENSDKRTSHRRTSGKSAPDSSPSTANAIRRAGAEFTRLTGLQAETVTRFERTDEGWLLEGEVLELARVPDTMSLMALYEITTDRKGTLTGYRRTRRYERGSSDRR
jgi:hypothetical protein